MEEAATNGKMNSLLYFLKEVPAWSVLIIVVIGLQFILVFCYARGIPVDDFLKGLILAAYSALFLSLNSSRKPSTVGQTETGDVLMKEK